MTGFRARRPGWGGWQATNKKLGCTGWTYTNSDRWDYSRQAIEDIRGVMDKQIGICIHGGLVRPREINMDPPHYQSSLTGTHSIFFSFFFQRSDASIHHPSFGGDSLSNIKLFGEEIVCKQKGLFWAAISRSFTPSETFFVGGSISKKWNVITSHLSFLNVWCSHLGPKQEQKREHSVLKRSYRVTFFDVSPEYYGFMSWYCMDHVIVDWLIRFLISPT